MLKQRKKNVESKKSDFSSFTNFILIDTNYYPGSSLYSLHKNCQSYQKMDMIKTHEFKKSSQKLNQVGYPGPSFIKQQKMRKLGWLPGNLGIHKI